MSAQTKKPEAKIRKVNFVFEKPFPKHWYKNNPIATHFMNAEHLVFPEGEKFFIRSVKAFADVYKKDPELKKRVNNFIGQEGTHFAEHQKFWDIMESHDLQPMKFVNVLRKTAWNGLEKFIRQNLNKNRFADKLCLSITVGLEHYTAMFAETGITKKHISKEMPDEMKDLFLWHAAEEIEHKAIPFDVLKAVDGSYTLRIGGMVIATIALWSYLGLGTIMLTIQDKDIDKKELPKYLGVFFTRLKDDFGGALSSQFAQYFEKDFHPDQIDNYHLAAELLAGKSYA
jgi:predicted metal-dependent hydrolase